MRISDWSSDVCSSYLVIPTFASLHTRFESYLDYYGLGWGRPLVEAHIRRFYRRSDHVLAPTPGLARDMKALRGDDKASVWSRGVDRARFATTSRDLDWRRARGIGDDRIDRKRTRLNYSP